jgi:hypothetical protein
MYASCFADRCGFLVYCCLVTNSYFGYDGSSLTHAPYHDVLLTEHRNGPKWRLHCRVSCSVAPKLYNRWTYYGTDHGSDVCRGQQ